ncbi:SRPBCC family protein [Micromonospora sp. CPCC 206061]|uniref:SRPBCC family protein n=1 Tax=Micromonospora sp. CPCC 206061 TaxID=3122410 RepID=UPI002FF233BC
MPLDIDVSAHSAADAATVYALVESGATWPTWTGLGSFELERPGEGVPEGVGAIRVFRTWPFTSREEIVERVPGRRLSYVLLSGMPLRNYRADIDLTPKADGTTIRWHSTFDPAVPGTGWFWRWLLGRFLRDCVNGLAREAGVGSRT